jgi:hypothetical protein
MAFFMERGSMVFSLGTSIQILDSRMAPLRPHRLFDLVVILLVCLLPLAAHLGRATADEPPPTANAPAEASAPSDEQTASPDAESTDQPEPTASDGDDSASEEATPAADQSNAANEAADAEANSPEQILQDQPSFLVKVDVDRPDRRYREGESLEVTIISEEDAYAYVLYEQADGKMYQIFPNSVQQDNKIAAKTTIAIPAGDDQFRWRVSAPFGKELVKVIATKEPLPELDQSALRKGRFNPVAREQIRRAANQLKGVEPIAWAEDQIEITTLAAAQAAPPRDSGRRFGVFFGVSKYEFNDVVEAVHKKAGSDWKPNLANPENDARAAAELMSRLGKLDGVQVFINEQATRRQMEASITGWLPAVTRPGDTVFIFFSGHGSRLKDDNGDEADGQDEWLLPYDYADVDVLAGLLEQQQAGRLDPALRPRYDAWLQLARQAGDIERANQWLCRTTGVTDDLLGHWLQRLSGRKVLVVIDACHAGGLAAHEKSVADEPSAEFDFLGGEVSRLKDIGQPDAAVLAACSKEQLSIDLRVSDAVLEALREGEKGAVDEWRPEAKLGVMTYYVVEGLLTGERPMTLAPLYEHCRVGMAKYFVSINEALRKHGKKEVTPHQPQVINYSSQAIVVKP